MLVHLKHFGNNWGARFHPSPVLMATCRPVSELIRAAALQESNGLKRLWRESPLSRRLTRRTIPAAGRREACQLSPPALIRPPGLFLDSDKPD